MAKLTPSLNEILSLKVKPKKGELHLLNVLSSKLDNSFEVYFNPYMNGDRPDIVIMHEKLGVLIIGVKDYDLSRYKLDKKKNLILECNGKQIHKSPISQVLKYKYNLFDLHIENLLEKKIKNYRHFKIVSCALYFHNSTSHEIKNLFITPYENDKSYLRFIEHNILFIGSDDLEKTDLQVLIKKLFLKSTQDSDLFTKDIYQSIKRFLKPPIHRKEEGKDIRYSKKQLQIIYDEKKQRRIKGVVGSGKTTVLAARAVQAYKRTRGLVLILTYNITLQNFIKDKMRKVPEDFRWENFVILNYHLFINSVLNNLSIPIIIPPRFDEFLEEEKTNFFEKNYYSNKKLFLDNKNRIKTYDAIFIDEIQDYKRSWMEIIKECFLSENGEYVLFGDVKQNIYNNKTEGKDISTNVRGVTELKNSFRSDFKIKDLAILYQKDIFKDKYEIDSFNQKSLILELPFERKQQGSLDYIYLPDADSISSLYTIIYKNIINKDIPPNDITILGNSISLLKKFDAFYRYSSNERTNTMFETIEATYKTRLRNLAFKKPEWLKSGAKLISQNKKQEIKILNQLSILFTLNDLYKEYPDRFKIKLDFFCKKFNTNIESFLQYISQYEKELKKDLDFQIKASVLERIRTNKKIHFYMNSGTIKISTIHSFKGWESDTVFLILENLNFQMTFDEILYTGITRTRSNLILINNGNEKYHSKLSELIKKVK